MCYSYKFHVSLFCLSYKEQHFTSLLCSLYKMYDALILKCWCNLPLWNTNWMRLNKSLAEPHLASHEQEYNSLKCVVPILRDKCDYERELTKWNPRYNCLSVYPSVSMVCNCQIVLTLNKCISKELCISDHLFFPRLWKHRHICRGTLAHKLFCPWHCVIQQKLLRQTGTQFDHRWPTVHTPSQTMSI